MSHILPYLIGCIASLAYILYPQPTSIHISVAPTLRNIYRCGSRGADR